MPRSRLDVTVSHNGYRWWYVDALSDDGQNGLTIIGFIGSVFSPYYARARKRGNASPDNHCAINVALYGTKHRWAMTERSSTHITRGAHSLAIGPSSLAWVGADLHVAINERCMPLPHALRGTVKLTPTDMYDQPVMLDEAGKHFWQAVAPGSRITVELENPKLSWSGHAYHDMNWGDEPLENGFKNWTWLRTNTSRGTQVLYDVERRNGSRMRFGHCFKDGLITESDVPQRYQLPNGFWGMKRDVNSEVSPRLIATLEDAPFYTRNHVAITLNGETCEAFHESLSLDRFKNPIVQMMLPFRMPRRP
jgi:carotenoid 1,2-hydratase